MLRITFVEEWGWATLRLDGKLIGPWVSELERRWEEAMVGPGKKPLLVDLKAVTYVDDPGKALLEQMHRRGAKLVGHDPMTKYLVAEIEKRSVGR